MRLVANKGDWRQSLELLGAPEASTWLAVQYLIWSLCTNVFTDSYGNMVPRKFLPSGFSLFRPIHLGIAVALLLATGLIFFQGPNGNNDREPDRYYDTAIREVSQPYSPANTKPSGNSVWPVDSKSKDVVGAHGAISREFSSLEEAFSAARFAVEQVDPQSEHSRGASFFAANHQQQLRFWFGETGVEFASGLPASNSETPWRLKLEFSDVRRATARESEARQRTQNVGSLSRRERRIQQFENRVEIVDDTTLITEWFVNRADGLEHGFTLLARPEGDGTEIAVNLKTDGNLRVKLDRQGGGLLFEDQNGTQILSYDGLKVWDSVGRLLPARIDLHGELIALVVNDANAKYPITIDPLFASVEARFVDETSAGAAFGNSVALDGNRAVLGAPFDDTSAGTDVGAAYVFLRSGTTWTREAKLVVAEGKSGDRIGVSVAISGGTVVLGARTADLPGATDSGCAYVFTAASLWAQEAKLQASDAFTGDNFGVSVAISGNTAIVGANRCDTANGVDAGAAYVFERVGTVWSGTTKLTARLSSGATDEGAGDQFGGDVALNLNTAVIGSQHDDHSGHTDAGSAYVFFRSSGSWTMQQKLTDVSPFSDDLFGFSVAIEGDQVIVGSVLAEEVGTPFEAGVALIYTRVAGIWGAPTKLLAPSPAFNDNFGSSVAISGSTALVGAVTRDVPGKSDVGSAFVYVRSGTIWSPTPQATLIASDGASGDEFAISVALSADTALIGARSADGPAGANSGAGYVYSRVSGVWSQQAKLSTGAPLDNRGFGTSVAVSGNTVVVGAPLEDTPVGPDSGSAYVFLRAGELWSRQAKLAAATYVQTVSTTNLRFAFSVAIDGDRIVIGAPRNRDGSATTETGLAVVLTRNGSSWTREAFLSPTAVGSGDRYGEAVAISGSRAVVAAPGAARVHTFVRTSGTWMGESTLGPENQQRFGEAIALENDTLLVGAPSFSGRAFAYKQTGGSWLLEGMLVPANASFGAEFGRSLSLSGDTAFVGAFRDDPVAGVDAGSAFVFERSNGSWSQRAKLGAMDPAPSDWFGWRVAVAGDKAVITSPNAIVLGQTLAGASYVFEKTGGTWNPALKLTAGLSVTSGDEFGQSVALSGDIAVIGATGDGPAGRSANVFILGQLPIIVRQPSSRISVPGEEVTFAIDAGGHAPLTYQWRRNGVDIPGAVGATYSVRVPNVAPFASVEGTYDVVVSNLGGVVTSAPASLRVNDLSQFTISVPLAPLKANGFLLVNLSPANLAGTGWRFVGEQDWRASGVPAEGLVTGNRSIEYRPIPGYLHPLREPVSVTSGSAATVVDREYFASADNANGALTVTLLPAAVNPTARWRLLGEGSSTWRSSGTVLSGLPPGVYLVECQDVPGYTTPPPLSVTVSAGGTPAGVTATYFLADALVGALPRPVITDPAGSNTPDAATFVGQLRSDTGAGTGFVVRKRVVATAAHVVFDDSRLAPVTGLQWLFQRNQGEYEPVPQIPRGSYILAGYSAQRALDNNPGASSPASQDLDVAAVWFFEEDAGRGGFGGYLASDSVPNEWLTSDRLKTLVGYPLDKTIAENRGRIHATEPMNVFFQRANGRVYLTDDITSRGGNSGGPLCVEYDGQYYPVAVYLGGTTQTRVRAIDTDLIRLFNSAEESGNTGQNSTTGGVPQSNSLLSGPSPGVLRIGIEPGSARLAGGGWRIGSGAFLASDQTLPFLSAGNYTVTFKSIPGFQTPAPLAVRVEGGTVKSGAGIYVPFSTPVVTNVPSIAVKRGADFAFQITASGGATSFGADGEFPGGVTFNRTTGRFTGAPTTSGRFRITLQATNEVGTGEAPLVLNVAPLLSNQATNVTMGQMLTYQISTDPQDGAVTFGSDVLPSGLNLQANGIISGIPTVAGVFAVPIGINNAGGTATAVLSLQIRPSIAGVNSASGQVGQAFSATFTTSATGATFSAIGLPPGLSIDPGTGQISGVASEGGTFQINVIVTNAAGSETLPVQLTIDSVLNVLKDGDGRLSGNLAGNIEGLSTHTPGENLFLQALPQVGNFFAGWTGDVNQRAAQLSFAMPTQASTVQANFRAFPSVSGAYSGLATGPAGSGQLKLSVTAKGKVTGKLRINGQSFPVKSKLDGDGAFEVTLSKRGVTVTLAVQLDALQSNPRFTGSVTGSVGNLEVLADRVVRKRSRLDRGEYDLKISSSSREDTRGASWEGDATATVHGSGVLIISGMLGEQPFTTSGLLTEAGNVVLYSVGRDDVSIVAGRLFTAGTSPADAGHATGSLLFYEQVSDGSFAVQEVVRLQTSPIDEAR
jgi:hypothetical protein